MKTLAKEVMKRMFKLQDIQFRSMEVDGQPENTVEGYASVFNTRTLIEDYFYEEIAPGAFTEALSSGADIRCLFNHNWDYVLGRMSAGTLQLEQDSKGLRFIVKLPNTTYANDLKESMRRGDVGECSFLFYPTGQEEDFSQDLPIIRITNCELYEVSIVTLPQYEEAKASLRSKQLIAKQSKRQKILKMIGEYV